MKKYRESLKELLYNINISTILLQFRIPNFISSINILFISKNINIAQLKSLF